MQPAASAGSIPAGTQVKVTFPREWNALRLDAEGWNESEAEGSLTISAERAHFGSTLLTLRLRPPANPVNPYDVLHARLGNGSLGESSLVVTYPSSVERSLPRAVLPTVPYPVRNGSWALFGVAFANGGAATVVEQVDVEIPGGYDVWRNGGRGAELFAAGAGFERPADVDGSWAWLDGRHLRWTGQREVAALGASSWVVGVRITEDVGQATSVEPRYSDGPVGRLTFGNGFVHESTRWGAVPGVVRHEVPAASLPGASDGYPWAEPGAVGEGAGAEDGGEALESSHVVELTSVSAGLRGSAAYRSADVAGDLVRARSGLANSSFAVAERRVPVGGVVRADADFGGLVNELARAGVASTTITVDLFAPASRGCAPTASWSKESSTLPLARVRDVALWDAEGLGVASVFVVAEDGFLYRVDAAGAPLWSLPLGSVGRFVEPMETRGGSGAASAERWLFVATDDGRVLRVHPLLGQIAWSAQVGGSLLPASGISALVAQPEARRVLAGTEDGWVVALEGSSGAVAGRVRVAEGNAVRGLAPVTGGGVHVAHEEGVALLDAGLQVAAGRAVPGVLGFASAPGRLLVATHSRVLDLALPTLAPGPGVGLDQAAVLAAAGDVTGDGAADLVVALEDFGLVAVDGASGARLWSAKHELWLEPLVASKDPFQAEEDDPVALAEGWVEASCLEVSATYQEAHAACSWSRKRDHTTPLHLSVGREMIYFAFVQHGNPFVAGVSFGGVVARQAAVLGTPDVVAWGSWPAPGEVVAVAASDGTITLYGGSDWRTPLASMRPTEFVGRFAFASPIPAGGFFGSHLLVARASWTEQGETREARLFDWFEVVGPDGAPVLEPSYRVVLVVQDRASPMER